MTVSELALLSKMSKAYISQVKHGKRPPSQKLLDVLGGTDKSTLPKVDYLALFLQSRQAGAVSPNTIRYYHERLSKFVSNVNCAKSSRLDVQQYLNSIPPNVNGHATRHASYRAIRAFYGWLNTEYGLPNPMSGITAPIMGKPILPSLTREQVVALIGKADSVRDKAIIALFTESGLRLSELAHIKPTDIDWTAKTIRVLGKGRKEALAPFGELSHRCLTEWLAQYHPKDNIWGLNEWGIVSMLRRLEKTTGLPCNPHTFRRTFACLLRKAGVDTMTIKDLGRWESLEMVQRYTRSVNFQDSLKFYKAPLG
jgi:integrase/recombinase XerC